MGTQQFCLRWNNHQANLLNVFDELLTDEAFVDVTLACEGLCVRAHKMVLSACSPYFKQLFLQNPCKHPIVILKDINFHELRAIIEFMYKGEVNISHEQLSAFLKTAETLKVKGLAEVRSEQNAMTSVQEEEHSAHDVGAQSIVPLVNVDAQQSPVEVKDRTSPTPKRRRVRSRGRSPSGSASDTNDNNVQQSSQPQEVVGPGDLSVVQLVQAVTSKHSDVVKLEAEPSSCSREDLVVIPDHVPVSNVSGISSGLNQEDSSGSFIHGDQSDRPSCMAEQQWDPSNHVQPSASGLQAIPSQEHNLRSSIVAFEDVNQIVCDVMPEAVGVGDPIHLIFQPELPAEEMPRPSQSEGPFHCNKCGRYINMYCNFVRHKKLHLQTEKLYKCHLCPSKYNRKDNLQQHLRMRHGIIPQRKDAAKN